ncbi:MAG TPA: cytochrome c oxidase subunit II [Phycisphaerales bacterium]|nr:cytochrome c oxidase subunit II [Phycisphaerales bacterium]
MNSPSLIPGIPPLTLAQDIGPLTRLVFGERGASALARASDGISLWILGFNIIWFVFLMTLMFYWSVRYRRRKGVAAERSAHHNTPLELTWTIVPSLFLGYMFYRGLEGYLSNIVAPTNAEVIDIRGIKWEWTATYPNGANPPERTTIGGNTAAPILYVPVGRPVLFRMTSADVLHSFWIPDFRYKFDVIPNRYTNFWIEAEEPGEHWIFCAEYCGDRHSEMTALLRAVPADEYDRIVASWSIDLSQPPEVLGKIMVERKGGCAACHSVDGSTVIGPTWKDAWGNAVPLADGSSIPADDPQAWDNYARESIVNPSAKVHAGFPPVMTSYAGVFSDEEIGWIIAYIRTLSSKGAAAGAAEGGAAGQGAAEETGAGEQGGAPDEQPPQE